MTLPWHLHELCILLGNDKCSLMKFGNFCTAIQAFPSYMSSLMHLYIYTDLKMDVLEGDVYRCCLVCYLSSFCSFIPTFGHNVYGLGQVQ